MQFRFKQKKIKEIGTLQPENEWKQNLSYIWGCVAWPVWCLYLLVFLFIYPSHSAGWVVFLLVVALVVLVLVVVVMLLVWLRSCCSSCLCCAASFQNTPASVVHVLQFENVQRWANGVLDFLIFHTCCLFLWFGVHIFHWCSSNDVEKSASHLLSVNSIGRVIQVKGAKCWFWEIWPFVEPRYIFPTSFMLV